MKNKVVMFSLGLLFLTSCTRIDAGHEGILVKQYGTDKGVQNVSLVTGRVWYNPWTEIDLETRKSLLIFYIINYKPLFSLILKHRLLFRNTFYYLAFLLNILEMNFI